MTASVVRRCPGRRPRPLPHPLGARDGIAARNLLGAILNEGGLAREAIGRIQVRDSFSWSNCRKMASIACSASSRTPA